MQPQTFGVAAPQVFGAVQAGPQVVEIPQPSTTVPQFDPAGQVAVPAQHRLFDEFLGSGGPATKSVELLSVSVHPRPFRRTAVVLLGAGVGAVPSKQVAVAPKPTRST